MQKSEIRDYEDEYWFKEATKNVDPKKLKPKKLRGKRCTSSGHTGTKGRRKTN